ncbi:MAG: flagellar protein FliS [Ignavibacteriaceae bacterium]|nr:flagellar protein FliS [Ignavibacteriaceae bacterium]
MHHTATLSKNKINSYVVKDILDSSPEKLLIKVYDFAVLNSEKKELLKTNNAIQELINMLRFDDESYRDLSISLFQLYQFCQEQARKNNFEIVSKILIELRESWIQAINNRQQ